MTTGTNAGAENPPGMLRDAAREKGIVLEQSYMIGDRWRDIEAGQRAGTRTIFIDHHYRETRPAAPTRRSRPSSKQRSGYYRRKRENR